MDTKQYPLNPELISNISTVKLKMNEFYSTDSAFMKNIQALQDAYTILNAGPISKWDTFFESALSNQMRLVCHELERTIKASNYLLLPQLQKLTDLTQISENLTPNQKRAFSIMRTEHFKHDLELIYQNYGEVFIDCDSALTPDHQDECKNKTDEDRLKVIIYSESKRAIDDYCQIHQLGEYRKQEQEHQRICKKELDQRIPMILWFLLGSFIPSVLTYLDSPTFAEFIHQLIKIMGLN